MNEAEREAELMNDISILIESLKVSLLNLCSHKRQANYCKEEISCIEKFEKLLESKSKGVVRDISRTKMLEDWELEKKIGTGQREDHNNGFS